ncbi:MAG: hypothetical protein ABI703_06090 [Gemmatimonadales bacterium]
MRRTLIASMALFAVVNAPAAAQTCLGLPSHSAGQMQVAGNASFTDLYNSYGGSFGYGQPAGVFAKANLGTTSYDVIGSGVDLGAQVGYQLTVGRVAQAQVCPVASLSLGMGPKDIDAGGTDLSSRQGSIGFAVGKLMGANPRMKIVPNAGLGLAYRKQKLDDGTNPAVEASETYGLASLGVGLIFNSNIAVRPSVSIPLGSDASNDPTFGLTVAYNFGTKAAPSRKR